VNEMAIDGNGGPSPKQAGGFIGTLAAGAVTMHDTPHSVMVDLIMVQVISLLLGSFLLLGTQGYKMGPQALTWTLGIVMGFFILAGWVYRRLSY
jgi:hypothetical protein